MFCRKYIDSNRTATYSFLQTEQKCFLKAKVSFLGVLYGNAQEVFCRLSIDFHGST